MINHLFRTLALASTLTLAALAPSAHADVLANIAKSGTIKIAVP